MTSTDTIADSDSAARDGEVAAAIAAREGRLMRRLADLEAFRACAMAMMAGLAPIAGEAPPADGGASGGPDGLPLKDRILAFSRLSRVMLQIVALEERMDQDAETRIARHRAEEAERAAKAATARVAQNKLVVRRVLKDVHQATYPDLSAMRLRSTVGDVLRDYETYDDYTAEPVEIVAKICSALGLVPDLSHWLDEEELAVYEADPKARAMTMAQYYLERSWAPPAAAETRQSRGPPSG